MDIFFEVVGWAGTVIILTGYFLLSIGRIPNGRAYQWLNLAGALGLLVNGVVHTAWPSAILNVVWSAIAIFALIRLARNRAGNTRRAASADSAII